MREHRRHLPKAVSPLEMLDDRIVPSAIGPGPTSHAALVGHASAHNAIHARVHHAPRPHHHAHAHVRVHVHAAPQVSMGVANSAAVGGQSSVAAPASLSAPTPVAMSTTPMAMSTGGGRAILPPVSTPAATAATATATAATTVATHAATPAVTSAATPTTTITDIGDIKHGPLAKAGQDLFTIYQEFVNQGSSATFTSSKAGMIRFQGTSVGIDAHWAGGNFLSYVTALTDLGMKVQTQDPISGTVEGYIPISQLPAAAQNAQTLALSPLYIPQRSAM